MIAPAQLRAARALLDWTRATFGSAAGVSPETIRNIETSRFEPSAETVRKITLAFAKKEVGFFDSLGGHQVAGVFLRQAGNDNDPDRAAEQSSAAFALANRMADAIAGRIRQHGQCRPRDLEKLGLPRRDRRGLAARFGSRRCRGSPPMRLDTLRLFACTALIVTARISATRRPRLGQLGQLAGSAPLLRVQA